DDPAGGKRMENIGSGDWVEFKINVPADGLYTVDIRLGVPSDSGRLFELRAEDGKVLRTINVPQYWANWFTLRTAVELKAGEQVIRFTAVSSSDFTMKYVMVYDKTEPIVITDGTTKIEAEELYDSNKGVISDLKENNQVIGKVLDYLNAGDWMKYSVKVEKSGVYTVTYCYSTQQGGVGAALRKDGQIITSVDMPSTGSWETYRTVNSSVLLPAGEYTIELLDLGDGYNIDWFDFKFEEPAYAVIYNPNGGTGTIPSSVVMEGETVTVASSEGLTAPSGKVFKEWNTKADGTGISYKPGDVISEFEGDLILYAIWETKSSQSPSPSPSVPSKPQADVEGIKVNADVDNETGLVKVNLTQTVIDNAFDKVESDESGKKTVTVNLPESKTESYSVELPANILASGSGERNIVLATYTGQIVLTDIMLTGTVAEGAEKVEISVSRADKSRLPENVANEVGDRPVIELTLKVDGEKVDWNNPYAPVKVSIPYEPTAEELKNPEHIVVWYIDENGTVVPVYNGRYNAETKAVEFTTTHFSLYSVAFVQKTFNDLSTVEWARKPIEVLASKGIIAGTGKGMYSPEADITRADYLLLLVKTLGLTAEFEDNFDDVSKDSYYYEAVGIARALGITAGAGNNRFAPNTPISRQDMMALTYRALKLTNKLDATGYINILDNFVDKDEIADYALEALATLVSEGLIVGHDGIINPHGQTTRASAAVLLYKIYNKF
ncbi:MAG: carbohydrate-binding protein, partial [Clostridiaceae bacterium]|nr:carbohydrate-binding protein [Clostridiaceae bacterium]